jgi:general secretion pathway protein A
MYKEFFGLKDYPFSLTPDPRFLVASPSYNELLASLFYGIQMAKGLIVLTGEVGTGKTTALRWIIRRLDASVLAAYIVNPHLSIEEFYHHLAESLSIGDWSNKTSLLLQLRKLCEDRHRRGLRTILIVDEAHELSDEVLEEIRLLMNFESDSAKHLQIVLTGQPELLDKLRQQNLRQLKQRVALNCKMVPLSSATDVERYISLRLKIAGLAQQNIFSPSAIDFIFQCSEGIPRQINNICDNAMIAAYSSDEQTIGRPLIEEIARDLDLLPDADAILKYSREAEIMGSTRVLTPRGREELLSDDKWESPQSTAEKFQMDAKSPNGKNKA